MSVRAELLRLVLRGLMKPRSRAAVTIGQRRRHVAIFERLVPRPPAETEVVRDTAGGVPVLRVARPRSRPGRHLLFLHGGGYVSGSPALYMHLLWRFADAVAARVVAIDYRLAPEHPFPAALDDAAAAWHGLIGEGVDPRLAAVLGDSAGGGLALALALRLRDRAAPLPAALVALSPWTDLAATGRSLQRNARADPMTSTADVPLLAAQYLVGTDPRDPYASPLYGDPTGLPPTLIQVGGDEVLLDDAVRMADRMRAAGVAVTLEVWPRMPHVWHAFAPFLPEARRAIAGVGRFVGRHAGD